jgi:hypothetical protein
MDLNVNNDYFVVCINILLSFQEHPRSVFLPQDENQVSLDFRISCVGLQEHI